jgi:hypothetical protein
MNWWRQSLAGMFRPASPEVLAARELDETRRQLLAAESAAEYADAMCAYHRSRIDRLQRYLKGEKE